MKLIDFKKLIENLPDDTEVVTIDQLGNEDEPFLIHSIDGAIILVSRKVAKIFIRENPGDLVR